MREGKVEMKAKHLFEITDLSLELFITAILIKRTKVGLPKQPQGICQLWNVCNVFLGRGQRTMIHPVISQCPRVKTCNLLLKKQVVYL